MRFEAVPFDQVPADFLQHWHRLQAKSSALASPFFSPEFAHSVGQCRDDLFVGIIECASGVSGVLPFHRKRGGCGAPLAGQMCDYQGVIGAPPRLEDITQMLRGFGLSSYDFNHALGEQRVFRAHSFWQSNSPCADLRRGYATWQSNVSEQTKALKSLARKERKVSREIGPLLFVENDKRPESWKAFKNWKNQAMRRLGQPGFPGSLWAAKMIEALYVTQQHSFSGCFSTLYAGDRLLAAHFGIRSSSVWHWWFPTYDSALSAYSPGLLLLRHCIEAAAQGGYNEVDFGRGTERYKLEFSNSGRAICEGSFERSTLVGLTRGGRKMVQRMANRILPVRSADIVRRGSTKVLRAGLL